MIRKLLRSNIRLGFIIMVFMQCLLLGIESGVIYVQAANVGLSKEEVRKIVAKIESNTYPTKEKLPSNISRGIDRHYSDVAPINEFWGSDGNYHVIYSGEEKVYISILDQRLKLIKTIEIDKDLSIVGNAIQDKDGNYYVVYGEYDKAAKIENGDRVVISVIKYDSKGKTIKKLTYTGKETDPVSGNDYGTREPFNYAKCELVIDDAGVLVCRYGRVMYNGHQSSHSLYVDTATMTKLNYISPYISHSFDQRVILTSDGGYLFAERGDAYDRGIVISKINKYMRDRYSFPYFIPFHFRNGYIYQHTYATIAGIAECSNGYVLVGASEKTLSYDIAKEPDFNESRNIFMQVFRKDFTSASTSNPSVHLLQGESRVYEGTYRGDGFCQEGAKDYGILWLTSYTGDYYASVPKLINIGNDQLLIMWEKKQYIKYDYEHKSYIESYYMVVSSDGSIIIPPTVIQDVRIPEFGDPDYREGKIYWTTSDGENSNFVIHCLSIGETMNAKIKVKNLSARQEEIVLRANQKIPIEVDFIPVNADNKRLRYEDYDTDIISVDSNGIITVNGNGETEVHIISEDNEKVSTYVKVYATDIAPTKLKAKYVNEEVKLTWNKTLIISEYEIYRSTKRDGEYEYVGYNDDVYYNDLYFDYGCVYYYKVKACDNLWKAGLSENPFSSPVAIYAQAPPAKFKAKKSSATSVQLTWEKCKDASGYEIYYFDEKTQSYKRLKTISNNTITAYKHSKLKSGKTNMYKIRAFKIEDGVKHYTSFSKAVKITL